MGVWQYGINSVSENGLSYMYNLVLDYEQYVVEYGAKSTINDFLKGWTCIPIDRFEQLKVGDIVYTSNGYKYKIIEGPYWGEDESYMYVTAVVDLGNEQYSKTEEILESGCVYLENMTHVDYKWRKSLKQLEEIKKCKPILIHKKEE